MGRKNILATSQLSLLFINRTFYILNNQLIDRSILQYLRDRLPLEIKQKNQTLQAYSIWYAVGRERVLWIMKLEYTIQPKDSWVLVCSIILLFLEIGCIAQW